MRPLRRWHRAIGITAAVLSLWLAITGLLLEYAPLLGWHERFVTNSALLRAYGVGVDEAILGYPLDIGPVAQVDERLFVSNRRLAAEGGPLVGATRDRGGYVVALSDALLRTNAEAEVLDRAGALEGMPTPIARVGVAATGALVIDGGGQRVVVAPDFLTVEPWDAQRHGAVRWSVSSQLAPLPDELAAAYLDGVISIERLLTDLHSGRLGGWVGQRLVDLGGVALIFLALSGGWLFIRPR